MAELMCSPDGSAQTINLQARISTLMALSRVFSAGGGNLDSTLAELVQAYSRWLEKEGATSEDQELLKQMVKTQAEKEKKNLVYEFNRLFVGPKSPPAPPYESVYSSKDHLVMKESTLDVRRWYRHEGLSQASISNEPDDYISTELEFAAYLLAEALEGYLQNQSEKAKAYIENYNGFCQAHLVSWLPSFVQKINNSAREELFITLGKIILKTVRPIQ